MFNSHSTSIFKWSNTIGSLATSSNGSFSNNILYIFSFLFVYDTLPNFKRAIWLNKFSYYCLEKLQPARGFRLLVNSRVPLWEEHINEKIHKSKFTSYALMTKLFSVSSPVKIFLCSWHVSKIQYGVIFLVSFQR